MSAYSGASKTVRVEIIASNGWLAKYNGQQCDATFYDPPTRPQIDSEQLNPPIPRWQSCDPADLHIIPSDSRLDEESAKEARGGPMTARELQSRGGLAARGKSGRKRAEGPRCACGKMLLATVNARRPAYARLGECGPDCYSVAQEKGAKA